MKNYIQKGDVVHTLLGSTVKGGDLVVLNDIIGVAITNGSESHFSSVQVTGVFELPKDSNSIELGKKVYWIDAEKKVSTTESGNRFIGYAWNDASAEELKVTVKIG